MDAKSKSIIRIVVSLVFIIILLYIMKNKYSDIVRVLSGTNIFLFIIAVLIFSISSIIASFRLKIIIQAQGIKLAFYEAVSLTFVGYFANNFLPTSIGGDVVKAHYLAKKSLDTTGSYTAIFVDRAVGLFTMILMAFFALIFAGVSIVDKKVVYTIYLITAIALSGVFFLINKNFAKKFKFIVKLLKPIENKLKKIYDATNKYRHHPELLIFTILISVLSQFTYFICISILVLSIGSYIKFIDVLLRMPIVSIITLIPSINGLGVREGSTVMLFGPLIGSENAFAISILMIIVLLLVSVLGALIWALSPQFKVKFKDLEFEAKEEAL